MKSYFPLPFPFDKVLAKEKRNNHLSLEKSIHSNICFLIFTRLGDFAYDRNLGFEIWDYDKEVFYSEREMYYEEAETVFLGTMESGRASKHFTKNLQNLIIENEPRLEEIEVKFEISRDGFLENYQRQILIEVHGRIKSNGLLLKPPVNIKMLYSPFKVEINESDW